MSEGMQFTSAHISSLAERAAQLEQIGEETQDPHALVRAARLYTLAVRIADEIDRREALPFMQSDLARVREELRTLAADAAANGARGERGRRAPRGAVDSSGSMTRVFREVAAGIEQRLAHEPAPPRRS